MDKFFKTILSEFSNDAVKTYMVDGSTIRDPIDKPFDIDFTEGDNDAHNPDMVPPGEIWIDLDVAPTEVRCTILHELRERREMISNGLEYVDAHNLANEAEIFARSNREQLNDLVLAELKLAPYFKSKSIMPMEAKSMSAAIYKTITTQVKDIGDGVLEFVGSVENTEDRDGDVIKASGWELDNYKKNPIIMWAHKYDKPPIGKAISVSVSKGKLIFQVKFADFQTYPFADTIYKLCKGGFLNATSVGFIPKEWEIGKKENDPIRTYTKQELLELSIVPVPSNPDALVTARDNKVITIKEFNTLTQNKIVFDDIRNAEIVDMTEQMEGKKPFSQTEIKDELDFCLAILKESTLDESNIKLANDLFTELKRFTGNDIPVEIKTATIRSIKDGCDTVLKTLSSHHEAHQKCYDIMQACINTMVKSLEDGNSGDQPATQQLSIEDFVNSDQFDQLVNNKLMEAING